MLTKIKEYWIGDILKKSPDLFEKNRAELTYRLTVAFLILYTGMIIHFSTLDTSLAVDFVNYGSLIGIALTIPIMKWTNSYFTGAFTFWIIGTSVETAMVLLTKGEAFLQAGVWHSFSIVLAFLLLGRVMGIISAVYSISLTILVELNALKGWNLFDIGLDRGNGIDDDPVAVLIPMVSSVYMLWIFMRTRDRAQQLIAEQKDLETVQRKQIEEKNREITDSIEYAKRIQTAILPPLKTFEDHLPNSFVLYLPKDVVAGDFYWFEPIGSAAANNIPLQGDQNSVNSEGVLFAAADCTGHGVPGAMVSVVCNNALNRSVREYSLTSPAAILDKTRELVLQEFEKSEEEMKDGMDIALVSLSLPSRQTVLSNESGDLNTQSSPSKLNYSGAHNPLWILRKGSQELEVIKANKQPIGRFDNPQPYKEHEIVLNKGDRFYLFTDGFADQFGGETKDGVKKGGKKLKAANFKKLLISLADKPISDHNEALKEMFNDWKGELEQVDDVCIIGVEI